MKPKICFIASADSIHSYKWIKYFAALNYEILWISAVKTAFDIPNGVRFHELPMATIVDGVKSIFVFRSLIKDFCPDFLHLHYIGRQGLLVLFSGACRCVATVWGSDILGIKKSYFKRWVVSKVLKKTSAVTCDAFHMKNEILKFGVPGSKIKIIMFGIDLFKFKKVRRQNNSTLLFTKKNVKNLISLRSFESVYDLKTLLDAMPLVLEKHPNTRLTLVGSGSQKQILEKRLQDLGISELVHFVGAVENTKIPEVLSKADIYISTALSDAGIAASTAEAMACELPVVVSDSGENSLWIENGKNGLIFPVQKPGLLAECLNDLLGDERKAKKLGKEGRKTIKNRNCFHREMKAVAALYDQLSKNEI